MNLSFAGCGFLGIYHVGVASCFREYAPHVLVDKISGASAGALAASALICGVPLGDSTSDVLRVVMKARARILGPFHPGFDLTKILFDGLNKMLPEDAHIKCHLALHISCTRVHDGANVLLNEFESRDDLIQALLCSCFIPFYSGIVPPKFHGVAYMDGGLSDNLPVLDDNTVTVSPFSGESDICPQDTYFNFLQINLKNTSIAISPNNLFRLARILFPPAPDVLTKMCQQGFDDALRFLQRNNLISCTRCLAVQTSFVISEEVPCDEEDIEREMKILLDDLQSKSERHHTHDKCADCHQRRQMALYDRLPEAVVTAIQDACEQLNKGIINWLFKHKYMKILSFLTVPYVLPVDITIVMISKILDLVPKLRKEMSKSFFNLLAFTKSLISKFDKHRHLYSAKFSCQLAITEYNYASGDKMTQIPSKCQSRSPPSKSPPLPCMLNQSKSKTKNIKANDRSRSLEEIRAFSLAQRKSYAGCFQDASLKNNPFSNRRQSMFENSVAQSKGPERVIKSVNFGFTMGLTQIPNQASAEAIGSGSSKDKRRNIMQVAKNMDSGHPDANVIGLSNKALNWEREFLHRSQQDMIGADTFENIVDVTNKQDALMAFYYLDEQNRVKITEIFNLNDADTSAVLDTEERETNSNLQWDESDYNSQQLSLDFNQERYISGSVRSSQFQKSLRRRKSLELVEKSFSQQPLKVRRFGGQWDTSIESEACTSFESDLFHSQERDETVERESNIDSKEFLSSLSSIEFQDETNSRRKSSFLIVE